MRLLGWCVAVTASVALLNTFGFVFAGVTCAASDSGDVPLPCTAVREHPVLFFLPTYVVAGGGVAGALVAALKRR